MSLNPGIDSSSHAHSTQWHSPAPAQTDSGARELSAFEKDLSARAVLPELASGASQLDALRNQPNALATRLGVEPATTELAFGDRNDQVATLQQSLLDRGYDPKGVDSIYGNGTAAAVRQFQTDRMTSIDNTLESGPPPMARSALLGMRTRLANELNDEVAGPETLRQLNNTAPAATAPNVAPPDNVAPVTTDAADAITPGSSVADVRKLQRGLTVAGIDIGSIDGDFGNRTAAGLNTYQTEEITRLNQTLTGNLAPPERAAIEASRDALVQEQAAGIAGPETNTRLKANTLRIEGPIDFSAIDPRGILLDERMNPEFVEKLRAVLVDLHEQGFEPEVFEGYRTFDRQGRLYAQGRTDPGDIVTGARPGRSWHQYGLGVDIVHQGNNKWRESPLWRAIGEAATDQGMYWGGNFGDRPHVELHPGFGAGDAGQFISTYNEGGLEAVWARLGLD